MEHDNFRFLSGGAYIRGMLRAYGKWLRLDEHKLFEMLEGAHGPRPAPSVANVVREPAKIPKRKRPHWAGAAVSAGAILFVLFLIGVMRPSQDVAAPPAPPKAKPSQAAVAQAGAPVPAPDSAATQGVAPITPGQGVQVTLNVVGDASWVEAYADIPGGKQLLFKGVLGAGTAKILEAKDLLSARIGNPGAVRVSLNGRDLGPAGQPGRAANFVFNPQTMALAP